MIRRQRQMTKTPDNKRRTLGWESNGSWRCAPGRRSVDPKCTWHDRHYWCAFCDGYYGFEHDACHTKQAMTGENMHISGPPGRDCVCAFCYELTTNGHIAAEEKYGVFPNG